MIVKGTHIEGMLAQVDGVAILADGFGIGRLSPDHPGTDRMRTLRDGAGETKM